MGYPHYADKDSSVHNLYHNNDIPTQRGFYRWHCLDPIIFEQDLKITLQQIGVCHKGLFERSDDVCAVSYWYQKEANSNYPALLTKEQRWPR